MSRTEGPRAAPGTHSHDRMLIPDTRGASFSSEASQILHQRLKEYGYGLMLCAYHHDREIEKEYIETLPKLGIAGLFHKPLSVGSGSHHAG